MSSIPAPVVFVAVPESLRGQVRALAGSRHHYHDDEADDSFTIDPAIPIPVELSPGSTQIDWERLSGEMILSGMIRVVMEEPDAPNAAYYRRFVLAVKPDILEEFTGAAILKAGNGEYDTALEILSALRGLFPQSPEVLLNRALILENRAAVRMEALERANRHDETDAELAPVREAYGELLALNPPFPDGLFNAGFFYLKRRDFALAKYCFSATISLTGDSKKQARAQAMLRHIEDSGLDDPVFQEAYDCIQRGAEQDGVLKIRDFLERRPAVWNGWFVLGWGLRRQGRWEDGAASFKKALELGGDVTDTRNELAICLMELGDYTGARKELEAALYAEPENIKIISNLGVLALKRGNDAEAQGFFRTVLELEPGDPVAAAYLQG